MSRIRTIKPEYWTDERVGECSVSARLLFIASWNFADDYGGLSRSARQLKAQAFPYDNIDCEPLVQELISAGLLIEYEAEGKKYLHIKGFRVHQKVEKPAKPRVPLYELSVSPPRVLPESSPVSNGSSLGREGKGKEAPPDKPATSPTEKPSKAKTAFPADLLEPSPPMRSRALQRYPDCDVGEMFVQFRAHHVSHDSRLKDWEQAWVTWLGNAEKFGYPRQRINGQTREAPIFR
jgi:hypothetical protein